MHSFMISTLKKNEVYNATDIQTFNLIYIYSIYMFHPRWKTLGWYAMTLWVSHTWKISLLFPAEPWISTQNCAQKKKKIVLKAVARSRHWTWNLFTPDLIKYNWCINARVKVILKIATHCHWTQAMNDLIQVKQKYPDHFT